MFKLSTRFILKVAVVMGGLFLITTVRMMISLNPNQLLSSLETTSAVSCDSCNKDCMHQLTAFQQEIKNLKDQIRELQTVHFNERLKSNVKVLTNSDRQICIEKIDLEFKLNRSDASHGQSYPSERHVPIYTRFDMWYQYDVYSTHGEKVGDKLSGLQRVSFYLISWIN